MSLQRPAVLLKMSEVDDHLMLGCVLRQIDSAVNVTLYGPRSVDYSSNFSFIKQTS
ncbi:Uncharacterised protein [Escherichia coli]|nr:Uncharacterised protein [Escherichia coli]